MAVYMYDNDYVPAYSDAARDTVVDSKMIASSPTCKVKW